MRADLPLIAIVGRPNVGKSALFNRICKQRISIVEDFEGVTRDRLYAKTEIFGKEFLRLIPGVSNLRTSRSQKRSVAKLKLLSKNQTGSSSLSMDR